MLERKACLKAELRNARGLVNSFTLSSGGGIMDSDRWSQIKPLFYAAAELLPEERGGFIRSQCDGDEILASEIESLLAAHDQAYSFIEAPAIDNQPAASNRGDVHGTLIGPYRIVREIGEGGMGAVYLAVRADESFEKQVAVKLIRRGLGADFIVRRFVAERQILARLEHPNIARLIDGGTTEDGCSLSGDGVRRRQTSN